MKFNKKQLDLLIKVAKQDGNKSITDFGKGIDNTYRMVQINMDNLVDIGLIEYETKKNKVIPHLTDFGKDILRTLI